MILSKSDGVLQQIQCFVPRLQVSIQDGPTSCTTSCTLAFVIFFSYSRVSIFMRSGFYYCSYISNLIAQEVHADPSNEKISDFTAKIC